MTRVEELRAQAAAHRATATDPIPPERQRRAAATLVGKRGQQALKLDDEVRDGCTPATGR